MKNKSVVGLSIVAVIFITALILFLSFMAKPEDKSVQLGEISALSDAKAGQNNKEIKTATTPSEIAGYYIDHSDGWYYSFTHSPKDGYDGTFTAGFDASHEASDQNPQKNFSAGGEWKIENGEIKLYSEGVYRSSMWICDGYIVDSLNYFVGKIEPDENLQQTVLVSRAGESGDTQVFNLYSDGKLIMEIIRNDGELDSAVPNQTELPPYQMAAGNYKIEDGKITITVGGQGQDYYIVDDGIAKWKYIKRQ